MKNVGIATGLGKYLLQTTKDKDINLRMRMSWTLVMCSKWNNLTT